MSKKKKRIYVLLVLVLIFMAGLFFANVYVKKFGYNNLWHFVKTYSSNKSLASNAKYETLEIKIDANDFAQLEEERNVALKRGMLVKEGNTYVNAKLKHNGKKIKAQLRLKGHMTDHLQDKKWSFRIKTKGGDAFMGMKVFSIQHPGTRNYIYEWIYHEMMKEENIIALNYDFIKVKVNDEDWGIYAVEEHFAQELVNHNNKPKGPLLRFNPDMYWQARIAEGEKLSYQMDFTSFNSTFLEAYDDKNTYKDSAILNGYQKASTLMEQFRNGNLKTSEVFDIKKLATFHAIIDVVGGHRSLDWSDVKYYFNAESGKIEPVAYESFSVQPTFSICGSNKYSSSSDAKRNNFHVNLFSDPIFFAEYIKQLNRIGTKKWLDVFLKKIDVNLQNKLAIVYTDYAYKDYSAKPYYENIKLIGKIIKPTKGIHAYLNNFSSDSLELGVAGVDALPFELEGLKIDSVFIKFDKQIVVPCKSKNQTLNYAPVKIKVPVGLANKISANSKFKLTYSLLGSKSKLQIDVIPISSNEFNVPIVAPLTDLTKISFIKVYNRARELVFNSGKINVDKSIVIPNGYTVIINPGTEINFTNHAKIISNSPVVINGTEENPVNFTSSDKTGEGMILMNVQKASTFKNLFVRGVGNLFNTSKNGAAITIYQSVLKIDQCSFFENNWNDIKIVSGELKVVNSIFSNSKQNAISSFYSTVTILNCNFLKAGENAILCTGSILNCSNVNMTNVNSGILASNNSEVILNDFIINNAKIAIEALNNSSIICRNLKISNVALALKAHKKGDVFGPSQITVRELVQSNNKQLSEVEKGSSINIIK